MSASPSIDAYDAQMLDFSLDPDVPMNITGSAEFFAEALMDHDGQLVASTYAEHPSVEVDMEEYVGDNSEYEMADETTEYQRHHGGELLDIEVYDASHAPSPLVPPHPLQPSVDVSIDSEHLALTSPAFSEHTALPEDHGEPESEAHPAPLDHPPADIPHVEPSVSGEVVSSIAVASDSEHRADPPNESVPPVSESYEQPGDVARTIGQPAPVDADDEAKPHVLPTPVAEEYPANSEVAQRESSELPIAESAPPANVENAYDSGPPVQDEKVTEQVPLTEGEAIDPLHISDDVYIDPPPAVLLSIDDPSEPGFALFSQPDAEGEPTEESRGNRKAYSLLLENRPTLYYEPLSSVFEVLRQDEGLLSRVSHSFEGELVLDAYDLQLIVSEDNVHSREISLHDLNILHDGSDFVGPLRLFLRAVAPRFIIRYYALQEQIQRLNVVGETEEVEHDDEHRQQYDTSEEPSHPQRVEAISRASSTAVVVSESLDIPLATEAKAHTKEPPLPLEPTEVVPQENYEPEDTVDSQQPASEYRERPGIATHTFGDDYEGAISGDKDESDESDRPDADRIHDVTAEDTNASETSTGQELEFGGEHTEYLDYVQPEAYDERYGEDLPERAGEASSAQYDEPRLYEEGEQYVSTAPDETQAILSSPDEDDEDKSVATPIPAQVVHEPALASDNTANEPVSHKSEKSGLNSEELTTGGSMNEVVHGSPASGNQEISRAQAKVFSEVNESDPNFVLIPEREADAEFGQASNPASNPEQNGQETSVQHDETWDEWDDEDAEGEDEEDWMDPDVASNESSVTLSSKASSKRHYDEVDPNAESHSEDPRNSPGPKRPRVQ